jgi:N-acetylglutamate synthase-like GNAT family acetyltransferase
MSDPILTSRVGPSFRQRFRHFFLSPNPLHPENWEGRLAPMTFRRFAIEDLPQCLEIYKLNEPGRFPAGVIDKYERVLRAQRTYVLVAEREGRIIATGGIAYQLQPHLAVLSFGLVRPDHQGQGVGTALVLARLALLSLQRPVHRVFIFAVEKSFIFYKRFGFQEFTPWRDPQGEEQPTGYLVISDAEVRACRKLLADHGISIPNDETQVPFNEKPLE